MQENLKHETSLYIGKLATDLGNMIAIQMKPVLEMLDIYIPVKSCSVIQALEMENGLSSADLAKTLKQSHQLINQKLPTLLKLNLIEKKDDPNDRRRKKLYLTSYGSEQSKLLEKHSDTIKLLYEHLSTDISEDIHKLLSQAIKALNTKTLEQRMNELS